MGSAINIRFDAVVQFGDLGLLCVCRKKGAPGMTLTQRSNGQSTRAVRKPTPKLLSSLVSR